MDGYYLNGNALSGTITVTANKTSTITISASIYTHALKFTFSTGPSAKDSYTFGLSSSKTSTSGGTTYYGPVTLTTTQTSAGPGPANTWEW